MVENIQLPKVNNIFVALISCKWTVDVNIRLYSKMCHPRTPPKCLHGLTGFAYILAMSAGTENGRCYTRECKRN
jgi:hypothetical protein